jgi:hypothetical protein
MRLSLIEFHRVMTYTYARCRGGGGPRRARAAALGAEGDGGADACAARDGGRAGDQSPQGGVRESGSRNDPAAVRLVVLFYYSPSLVQPSPRLPPATPASRPHATPPVRHPLHGATLCLPSRGGGRPALVGTRARSARSACSPSAPPPRRRSRPSPPRLVTPHIDQRRAPSPPRRAAWAALGVGPLTR